MKTSRLLGFLIAVMMVTSVTSCTSTYYSRPNYGRHYGARRPAGPPPPPARPYNGNYGYGRRGW